MTLDARALNPSFVPKFPAAHDGLPAALQAKIEDLVIRDNRYTMRRATAFEDTVYRRDVRRTTVYDPAV